MEAEEFLTRPVLHLQLHGDQGNVSQELNRFSGTSIKRIKSFCVAIASLKLWLDEISAGVGLEFWRQLGRWESWFESDEASGCECGWSKVACLQDERGR